MLNLSRRELRDEPHARFNEVRAQIRIALMDGTDFVWEIAEPTLLLAKLVRESGKYSSKPCVDIRARCQTRGMSSSGLTNSAPATS